MKSLHFGHSILFTLLVTVAGCDQGPQSSKGFRLPDGDPQRGQLVFVELECHDCHAVKGLQIPAPAENGPVHVVLGGPVSKVKTYGQLVSAVINPSHKLISHYPAEEVSQDGESLMRNYNAFMTVEQLVHLVAFLQPRYQVTVPQYSYYSYKY